MLDNLVKHHLGIFVFVTSDVRDDRMLKFKSWYNVKVGNMQTNNEKQSTLYKHDSFQSNELEERLQI